MPAEIMGHDFSIKAILDANIISRAMDIVSEKQSVIELLKDENINFDGLVNKRDFIYYYDDNINELLLIDDISDDSKKMKITCSCGFDIFDFDVCIENQFGLNIEQFIADSIIDEYQNNILPFANININVIVGSSTTGTIIAPDKVLKFRTLIRQMIRIYNIYVDIALITNSDGTKYIQATVSQKPQNSMKISEIDNFILKDPKKKFAEENATKYTIITPTATYQYFLKTNGYITDDATDSTIITSVVDKKIYSENITNATDAEAEAVRELEKTYNNEIELEVSRSFYDSIEINTLIEYYLLNGNKINTVLSKKEWNNGIYKLTFGTARTRLTDKIKKGGYM